MKSPPVSSDQVQEIVKNTFRQLSRSYARHFAEAVQRFLDISETLRLSEGRSKHVFFDKPKPPRIVKAAH